MCIWLAYGMDTQIQIGTPMYHVSDGSYAGRVVEITHHITADGDRVELVVAYMDDMGHCGWRNRRRYAVEVLRAFA